MRMVTSIFLGSTISAAIVFSSLREDEERRSSSDLLKENSATSEPEKNAEKKSNARRTKTFVSIRRLTVQPGITPRVGKSVPGRAS